MIDVTATVVMLEELSKPKGATRAQLAEATGFHLETVKQWIRAMHNREHPVIYILSWKIKGNQRTPAFAFGYCMEDCPRPISRTPAQRAKDYRERKWAAAGKSKPVREAALSATRRENVKKLLKGPTHLFVKETEHVRIQEPRSDPQP